MPVSVTMLSGWLLTNDPRVLSRVSTRSAAKSSSQCAARPSLYFAYASLRIAPERPFGGVEVPNTGVRNLCSIERSRGHFSGWRSGNSHRAPLAAGSKRSRGTAGRALGARAAPPPPNGGRGRLGGSARGGVFGGGGL